jgi:hypothetical protein
VHGAPNYFVWALLYDLHASWNLLYYIYKYKYIILNVDDSTCLNNCERRKLVVLESNSLSVLTGYGFCSFSCEKLFLMYGKGGKTAALTHSFVLSPSLSLCVLPRTHRLVKVHWLDDTYKRLMIFYVHYI